eukprot:gene10648-1935_t
MVDLATSYQKDPQGTSISRSICPRTEPSRLQQSLHFAEYSCCLTGLRNGKDGKGDVGRLAVARTAQRRGVCRLLLSALLEHASKAGFPSVTATTCALNSPALAAFFACGFQEVLAPPPPPVKLPIDCRVVAVVIWASVQVWRGRSDGKPSPEWVPFVRLEHPLGFSLCGSVSKPDRTPGTVTAVLRLDGSAARGGFAKVLLYLHDEMLACAAASLAGSAEVTLDCPGSSDLVSISIDHTAQQAGKTHPEMVHGSYYLAVDSQCSDLTYMQGGPAFGLQPGGTAELHLIPCDV